MDRNEDPVYGLAAAIVSAHGPVQMDRALELAQQHVVLPNAQECQSVREKLSSAIYQLSERTFLMDAFPLRHMPPYSPSHWQLDTPAAGGNYKTVEALATALTPLKEALTVYRDEDNRWFVLSWLKFNDGHAGRQRFKRMTPEEIKQWLNGT